MKGEITEGFGFSIKVRDSSDTERILGMNLASGGIPQALEAYSNTFLEMFIGDARVIGIYRGRTEDGFHVIMPTTHPTYPGAFEEHAKPILKNSWKSDVPLYVSGEIRGFRPASREILENSAMHFDEVSNLGSCLEDKRVDKQLELF